MDIWKDCPQILIHKLFLTLLIGVGCLLVGIAYFCFYHDFFFLVLSAAVFISTLRNCDRGRGRPVLVMGTTRITKEE